MTAKSLSCGVDIGGTKSAAVLLDDSGEILATYWHEHGGPSAMSLADMCLKSVEGVLRSGRVETQALSSLGLGVAGLMSADHCSVAQAATLGATNLSLGSIVGQRLKVPTVVMNDANATLWGYLASQPDSSGADELSVLVTIGTGLGGAIVTGGELIRGHLGFAGEFGHMFVDEFDRRTCPCGTTGCVENFASGRGLVEVAATTPVPELTQKLIDTLGFSGPLTASQVIDLAKAGDSFALGILERAGTMLGRALNTLSIVLDPARIIISGTVGVAAGEWFVPSATVEMRRVWPFEQTRQLPTIIVDELGPYVAATGAALYAKEYAARDKEKA